MAIHSKFRTKVRWFGNKKVIVALNNGQLFRHTRLISKNCFVQLESSLSLRMDVINYYNRIAEDYDDILAETKKNSVVRKKVSDYISSIPNLTTVMDFGCGTGLDIAWMVKNGFKVYCLEPSENMRSIAEDKNRGNHLVEFIRDEFCDFRIWSVDTFDRKFDSVLANFGVLNSIGDLNLLFEKIALILGDGGHFFGTIPIIKNFRRIYDQHNAKQPNSIQKITYIKHHDLEMPVYVYTSEDVITASKALFEPKKLKILRRQAFIFIHLIKKG